MKKFFLVICLFSAIIACNRAEIVTMEEDRSLSVVNEAAEGSIPVTFKIRGNAVLTKANAYMPNEDVLINVRMIMTGYNAQNAEMFSETIDLGTKTDVIVNVRKCNTVAFSVFSGVCDEDGYHSDLESQSEYLYAEGNLTLQWSEVEAQTSPFELKLARMINKITIEKISVDWTEDIYNSKEFRIKRIYLADVPRNYEAASDGKFTVYEESFSKEKEDIRYYNIGGIDGYSYYDMTSGKYYYPVTGRLDAQLIDEVDVVVSKDSPYTTPHIFYTYLNNSTVPEPSFVNAVNRDRGYITLSHAMSTMVIEAEMDGQKMYYRFQIHTPSTDSVPTNTHIRFRELQITELGALDFKGAKTYRSLSYEFDDWDEEVVEGPLGCI